MPSNRTEKYINKQTKQPQTKTKNFIIISNDNIIINILLLLLLLLY